MVDELKFTDNVDKWQLWKTDKPAYNAWFESMSGVSADPKKGAPGGARTNLGSNAGNATSNANPAANPTTSTGGDE